MRDSRGRFIKGCTSLYKGKKSPMRGVPRTEEVKKKISAGNTGKVRTEETKKQISETLTGKPQIWHRGENNHFWKGGVTKKNRAIRMSLEYKNWRRQVYERDDYTCQECKVRGGKLNADHIKPFSIYIELRFDVNNGRTLCEECHRKTETFATRHDLAILGNIVGGTGAV